MTSKRPLGEFNIIQPEELCGLWSAVLVQDKIDKAPMIGRLSDILDTNDSSVIILSRKKDCKLSNDISNNISNNLCIKSSNDLCSKSSSDLCSESSNRASSKTKFVNRKYVSMASEYRGYKVNATKSGIYTQIMNRIVQQMEAMRSYYNRMLVVRLDLHLPYNPPTNERLSKFLKAYIRWAKGYYRTERIGYIWAREADRSVAKKTHYHLALIFDNDKVLQDEIPWRQAIKMWSDPRYEAKDFRIYRASPDTKKHGTPKYIRSDDDFRGTIFWLSYLAKARGKGYRSPQAKDYGATRHKQAIW